MQLTIKKLSNFQPRKNLPAYTSNKRGESLFLIGFAQILKKILSLDKSRKHIFARELDLNGYGIADLIILELKYPPNLNRGNINSLRITSFEIKMKDWRKALQQAFRYKYYSNRSIVVLPNENINNALKSLEVFKSLGIGLWAYDQKYKKIYKFFTPRNRKPLNQKAKQKAISIIRNKFKLPIAV